VTDVLSGIYDQLLLTHIRAARNYGLAEGGPPATEIRNTLCGDRLQLQLSWHEGRLRKLAFSCDCCGISMGNTSLMSEMLPGLDREGARRQAAQALEVLRGGEIPGDVADHLPADLAEGALASWQLLAEIARRLPARRTCASLGWQALAGALDELAVCDAREIR
jgi:NifU-like protein involved in Fe-S cluster formation